MEPVQGSGETLGPNSRCLLSRLGPRETDNDTTNPREGRDRKLPRDGDKQDVFLIRVSLSSRSPGLKGVPSVVGRRRTLLSYNIRPVGPTVNGWRLPSYGLRYTLKKDTRLVSDLV